MPKIFAVMVLALLAWVGVTPTAHAQVPECVVYVNDYPAWMGPYFCFVNQPCDIQVWSGEGDPQTWDCGDEGTAYIGFDSSSAGNAQSAATALVMANVAGTGISLGETEDDYGDQYLEGGFTPTVAGYYAIGLGFPIYACYEYDTQALIVAVQVSPITWMTVLSAPDGTPNTRTTVGALEDVDVTFNATPEVGSLSWSTTAGSMSSYSSWTSTYTAPFDAITTTVQGILTLTAGNAITQSVSSPSIFPTGINLTRASYGHFTSPNYGIGMGVTFTLTPTSAVYSKMWFSELSNPAIDQEGFYLTLGTGQPYHYPYAADPTMTYLWCSVSTANVVSPNDAAAFSIAQTSAAPYDLSSFSWQKPTVVEQAPTGGTPGPSTVASGATPAVQTVSQTAQLTESAGAWTADATEQANNAVGYSYTY